MGNAWHDLPAADWPLLRSLLDQALSLPASGRQAWLDALQGHPATLRNRLRALLAHADEAGAFSRLPRVETTHFAAPAVPDAGETPGAMVGPYRLLRHLGQGGMASVWLAERTDQLQGRQVALKLPHGAWQRAGLVERLAREREILATLEHPHIARLYDAGLTAAGQPFLALEWVDGEPLDRWCAARASPLRARLAIFLQVCDAVAHAHARLVVHRDLKPSNILVDQQGQAHLLDFGIAKLLQGEFTAETAITRDSGPALTPEYAAPEQIAGRPLGTAADVYALGVVLFELLTGSRPYTLAGGSLARLEQAVLETEPPRPSSRVADASLQRALLGDLDTIVLKALKKAPEDRYDSVRALADDLRRHLADQPVLARPDSRGYRLRKWLLRNRLVATAGSVVLVAVLGGAGVAVWQAQVAFAERDRAQQVRGFIESIFRDADPYRDVSGPPTVAALLRRAHQRAQAELAPTPDLHVHMLDLVGASLKNLQDFDGASQALDEAVRVGRERLGDSHPQTLAARVSRVGLYRMQGRSEEARSEIDRLLPELRTTAADPTLLPNLLLVQASVALDQGRYADAQSAAAEGLAVALRTLGERDGQTVQAATLLAVAHEKARQPDRARTAAEQALRLSLALHGGNTQHADSISARSVLARSLGELGELRLAIQQFDQVILDGDAHFGASALENAFFRANQVKFLLESGQGQRGIEVARQALQGMSQRAAPGSHFVPGVRVRLAQALIAGRRIEEAVSELRPALRDLEAVQGPNHAMVLAAREDLALALAYMGQPDEAASLLVGTPKAKAGGRELRVRSMLARQRSQHEAALEFSTQALASAEGPRKGIERMRLLPEHALSLLEAGRPEQALAAFNEALQLMDRYQAQTSADRADVWLGLARAHLDLGQPAQALAWLQKADAFWRGFAGADARFGAEAAKWLARARSAAPGGR